MSTLLLNPKRVVNQDFFSDRDRIKTRVQRQNEITDLRIDYADFEPISSGETISTSTWTADGVTTSAASNTNTTTSITVSGTNGRIVNKITTSGNETFEVEVRYVSPEGHGFQKDYRL